MDGVWGTILVILGLIALYLILVYSGGATAVLGSIGSVTTQETKILQGR
jgi:di/tricarboxylate transporter